MLNKEEFSNKIKMKYKIGGEKNAPIGGNYYHICENIEDEVDADEVNLSSFELQNQLADIWDEEGNLDLQVRDRLLDIANDFWETCNIKWVKPTTVILTGSICNYNWSEYSDIDLHLVVDFSKVHAKTEFVKEYFDDKKNEWNNEHDSLEIHDFSVELYVQDIHDKPESGGEFDLYENKWIKKTDPHALKPLGDDKYSIRVLSARLMTKIDNLWDAFNNENDLHKIEVIGKKADVLLKHISNLRQEGLKHGEMGMGNICYKVLRRSEYLDKIWKLQTKVYDKLNSIDK